MSCSEWLKMEHPEEETYVYDQHCTNCRYFYCDDCEGKVNKHPACHNPESEYNHKVSPTMWCWAWKKARKPYTNASVGSDEINEIIDAEEVAADA